MRVLHLIIIILVIAAIGLGVTAFLDMAPIPALNEVAWNIKGYAPAKTPEEAIEKYNKAMGKRNYAAAARYLDDEYQRKFRNTAKVASKLSEAVVNFRSTAKANGIQSDKVEKLLLLVDPFPSSVTTEKVYPSEGGDVTADIKEEFETKRPTMTRRIAMKKVNDAWRLDLKLEDRIFVFNFTPGQNDTFPVETTRRLQLEFLDKHGQDLVNALNVVKNRIKTDATTKENVSGDLQDELQKALKGD